MIASMPIRVSVSAFCSVAACVDLRASAVLRCYINCSYTSSYVPTRCHQCYCGFEPSRSRWAFLMTKHQHQRLVPLCRVAQRSGVTSPLFFLVGLRGGTALSTEIFAGFPSPLKRLSPVTHSLTTNQCSHPNHLDTTYPWLVQYH